MTETYGRSIVCPYCFFKYSATETVLLEKAWRETGEEKLECCNCGEEFYLEMEVEKTYFSLTLDEVKDD